MKIAIISDTHDSLEKIKAFLQEIKDKKIDLIIHAGDFCSPYTAFSFEDLGIPMIGVFGNNDGDKLALKSKYEGIAEISDYCMFYLTQDGDRIVITHYPDLVKSLAKSGDYDYVIYGHTHKIDISEEGECLIINSGTLSGHLAESASFIILNTNTKELETVILE